MYHLFCQPSTKRSLRPLSAGIFLTFFISPYYRSGSVLREITGKELDRALLKSQGRTWDGVPLPRLSASDLKSDAIALFKQKAISRGRLSEEDANVSNLLSIFKIENQLFFLLVYRKT